MIRPDDDEKPFVARWNSMMRILLVDPSVKHIGRAASDYADFLDGTSCHPSNERLARETGYSEKAVRTAWGVLRGLDLAQRVSRGVAHLHRADEYHLDIPKSWYSLPILGPSGRKFTCLACSKVFNPQGNCSLSSRPGEAGTDSVRFDVTLFCFCPPPRKNKGREGGSCFDQWARARKAKHQTPWHELGGDVWRMFEKARGEAW